VTCEYTLSPIADSIAEARQYVREALGADADPDTLGVAELVVSELITNSVIHGPEAPITLRLSVDGKGGVTGEVADHGGGATAIRMRDDSPTVGGLGLIVVDRLASAWGVHPDGAHVWFRVG
jgi:anti-sigma regulatory factor (Ser/Thr protein kinase)